MKFRPEIIRKILAQEPEIRRCQIEAMCRKGAAALDSAAGLTESDPAWLWKLKINGGSALDEREVEHAFLEAAKDDNNSDFQKAVKARASRLTDAEIKGRIDKTDWLLLEFWLAKEKAPFFRSLCYYNDKALAKLVDYLLGTNQGHYNEKSIRKVWERLGLKRLTRPLFRDVEILPGKPAMPIPYRVRQIPY